MKTIKVDSDQLLATLEENREKHKEQYKLAKAAWIIECTDALQDAADLAVAEGKITINPLKDLPKPQSYLSNYDDAIARVKWDRRDELELDDYLFSSWVQDKWNWHDAFTMSNSIYSGTIQSGRITAASLDAVDSD